ncbi:MAG: hypothetical protein IKN57_02520, partial [Parasporobacterium sp.]|nr:hypothetical protein [Parasporobacterium sp.]
ISSWENSYAVFVSVDSVQLITHNIFFPENTAQECLQLCSSFRTMTGIVFSTCVSHPLAPYGSKMKT